jgi:outer membrane receptor protein involved in Fe transport
VPTEDLLLYASAGKGFRPGGGTGPIPTSGTPGTTCEQNLQSVFGTTEFVPSPQTFNPDSVWSYEIGEKLRALDNRLVINGAVYYSKWKAIQQTVPLPCAYNFTGNVGDAEIKGAELEIEALIAPGLTLSLNGSYTHAVLVSSNVIGVGVDVGSRVQDVPEWTSSQSLAYRHNLSNKLALTARIQNDYVGSRTDATYAINTNPSYDLTTIRAGVEGDRWSASLFVDNVFNRHVLYNNATMISVNLPQYNRAVMAQPVTFGLDVNYRFGSKP